MLTAGAAGVQLQFPVYQNNVPVSLQSASAVTLTIIDPKNVRTTGIAATVGTTVLTLTDGTTVPAYNWCYITTTSTMFASSGVYQAQIFVTFPSGIIPTDAFSIPVGINLNNI